MKIDQKYMKPQAASAYLGISRRHLHDLTARGKIPVARLSPKVLLYDREVLDGLLKAVPQGLAQLNGDEVQ